MSRPKTQPTSIEHLEPGRYEQSDEHLRLASGGQVIVVASYRAASCTQCNDTDYYRCD